MPKKNSVPYGWRSLQAVGTRVLGSRFIAFKVPLKGVINQRLTPNQKFTPKDLIAEIRAQGEELGIVIDLTNTNRYYEVKDLPKNVSYQKLPTAGLEVPDDDAILQFKKIVRKFLRQNQHNDKLVGVHCTTGLSRTGYLICRYLVDVDGWNPDVAMKAFNDSRGLPMDGRVYVADLKIGKHRTNEGIDDFDPDEDGGPVTLPQYEEPARAEWSENAFPATQSWVDFKEQRDAEGGNLINRGPDDQFQYNLEGKMLNEGYEVLRRPEHGLRTIDNDQEPRAKRHFEDEGFHRPVQRSGPFPEDRYDFESGRSRDIYNSQHGSRPPLDSLSFDERKGQPPLEETYFQNNRPEQRTRPFPGESRDFRDWNNPDLINKPPGQRPRLHHGQTAHEDFNSQMHLEENDFRNSRPEQRFRPLTEGEPQEFSPERVREGLENAPGQRPKPLTIHDLQTERQMEDGFGNRGKSYHGRDACNLNMDAQIEESEFANLGPSQGARRLVGPPSRTFEATPQMEDFSKRSYQQRHAPYGPHSPSRGFQNDRPMEGRSFTDRDFGQRPFHGPQSRDLETELEMEDSDFLNNGTTRRAQPFRDYPSHELTPAFEAGERGFSNMGPSQRPRSFHDHQMEMNDRGYSRPGQRPFEGQSQSSFPPEQLPERGTGYPVPGKRMRVSEEVNEGERFAPYSTQGQPPPISKGQAENPRHYERATLDRPGDGTYVPFDNSYGLAENQNFAPEENFRERSGVPRRSRFH